MAPQGALRPIQLEALDCLARLPAPVGALLDLPVGAGKTGVCFLAPLIWGSQRPLLLVPGDLLDKTQRDLEEWYERTPLLRGRAPTVIAHHEVSLQKGANILRGLAPDAIVIDEAHAFARLQSARTKRLVHYVAHNAERVRVVGLSGTLLGRDVDAIAHLATVCCRQFSPLPDNADEMRAWSQVLNRGATPDEPSLRVLSPLVAWATAKPTSATEVLPDGRRRNLPKGVPEARAAFGERWRTAPSVVSSSAQSCGASLVFRRWRPALPAAVKAAMDDLSGKWVLPDGSELVDSVEIALHAQTLSWGFWHKQVWDASVGGEDRAAWLEARRAWGGASRNFLAFYARPGLDSLGLIQAAVEAGPGGPLWGAVEGLAPTWERWVGIRARVPSPESEPVWLDGAPEALAGVVRAWQTERDRGLVWFRHRAVGAVLRDAGLLVYAGGDREPPASVEFPALSIPVFHKGFNLQAWSENLLLELPDNVDQWEQLIGRTHRQGQTADVIRADVAQHTWALQRKLSNALDGAAFVRDVKNAPQKILLGTWL